MTRRTSAYASAPASSTGNETTERREPRQVFGSAIGQGAELRVSAIDDLGQLDDGVIIG